MTSGSFKHAILAVAALLLAPISSFAAWELNGTKSIYITTSGGTRIKLGSVDFKPTEDASIAFKISLDTTPFTDHFLSMREFKCIQGTTELTCHVPYPYTNPRTVRVGNFAWLEHSLLFFYKLPSEFGAKLWNGIYFELKATESGLVGTPKAIDLNLIAAPPANTSSPPYRSTLRDDMPSNVRWIRSLSIE